MYLRVIFSVAVVACSIAEICVDGESMPQPVNGGWSEWVTSECSRTCDCGVQIRQRLCNSPSPEGGGTYCEGEDNEITLCNTDVSCGNTPSDHRNEQCAATNDEPLDGQSYNWLALFNSDLQDQFYCQNPCHASGFDIGTLRPPGQNEDGTDCWDFELSDWSKLYKCVEGSCTEFGCDGVFSSTATYDSCRVCNGIGSTCTEVSGSVNTGTMSAFNSIVTVPTGAVSLFVRNADLQSGNHIAIGSTLGDFFRGSGSSPATEGRTWYQTFTVIHSIDDPQEVETFISKGPTTLDLNIEIYLTSAISGSITYEYYMPTDNTMHFWNVGTFGDCSVTCGVGSQTRPITCDEVIGTSQTVVDDSQCISNIGPKPSVNQPCSLDDCPSWVTGEFGNCNAECGSGQQTRTVECKMGQQTVDESMCTNTKPETTMPCDVGSCEWNIRDFGSCTVTCGEGTMTGTVFCANGGGSADVVGDENCSGEKPDGTQACNEEDCKQWVTGDFGQCSTNCGKGIQSREVLCRVGAKVINLEECDASTRPSDEEGCISSTCPRACDVVFLATDGKRSGTFSTPRFPRTYPRRSKCSTWIFAEEGKSIEIIFRRFKLQANQRRGCKYDYLLVTDLITGRERRYCGTRGSFSVTSNHQVLLYFQSDVRRNFRGFSARFEVS